MVNPYDVEFSHIPDIFIMYMFCYGIGVGRGVKMGVIFV
jgi:hypothetical protein